MDNQHTKITGYRDLTQAEIDLMNEIKAHGIATEALLSKVQAHLGAQSQATTPRYADPQNEAEVALGTEIVDTEEEAAAKKAETLRLNKAQPFRWLAIANTHLQEGTMALVRAVAQPSTF